MHTKLERKLIEDGFIDENGVILKGNFKKSFTLTEINRKGQNGETILVIMAGFVTSGDFTYFEVSLSEKDLHAVMHTKNLIELEVDKAAINTVVNSIFREMSTKAADTIEKIYIAEDTEKQGKLRRGELKNIERTSYSQRYMYVNGVDFSKEAYEPIRLMPKSFWEDSMIKSQFKQDFFGALNSLALHRSDTPEAIVVFRAYGNEVGNNCIGEIAKITKTASDSDYLGEMLEFETKMHGMQNKAEGLSPIGGEGK